MKKFFKTIASIHQYTMELDRYHDSLKCKHCFKQDQFISHGFVYKKARKGKKRTVGKRIFCSNRYGRSGCGSTFRLYLSEEIPTFQYTTTHLFAFLTALFALFSIQNAYEKATGTRDPRNAWRWLNKLQAQLIGYRQFLKTRSEDVVEQFKSRTQRLQILLPTIQRLFLKISEPPCAHYQTINQVSFI